MSVDIHIDEPDAEKVRVKIDVNKGGAMSKWQKLNQNHPILVKMICLGGGIALGAFIGFRYGTSSKRVANGKKSSNRNNCKDSIPKSRVSNNTVGQNLGQLPRDKEYQCKNL